MFFIVLAFIIGYAVLAGVVSGFVSKHVHVLPEDERSFFLCVVGMCWPLSLLAFISYVTYKRISK